MKYLLCTLIVLAGFGFATVPANAVSQFSTATETNIDFFAGLATQGGSVYCPKKCTDRADCADMCLTLGCDIVYARDGTTCSCERILAGGPCPEGRLPRAGNLGGGISQQ
jgi:hypothetical protein